jgi:hypothetical protein
MNSHIVRHILASQRPHTAVCRYSRGIRVRAVFRFDQILYDFDGFSILLRPTRQYVSKDVCHVLSFLPFADLCDAE